MEFLGYLVEEEPIHQIKNERFDGFILSKGRNSFVYIFFYFFFIFQKKN